MKRKRTRIIALALVLALTAASIYAFANNIPSSGTTTIVPNRLTVAWDDDDGTPITIDTFRFFGYNVAQLRTMVNVLEGTVTNNADGTFQIRDSGAPVSFQDIGFSVSTEIQYIINNTRIRNNAGQLFTPAQPGWVFLPSYEYNWASVRDIISAMDLVLVDFTDDPAAGTTEVIVARREANDQQAERPPSGPAVNRPGNGGNWRGDWRTTPPSLTATPTPSPGATGNINGRVVNAETNEVVSGAALTLVPTNRTTDSLDNGNFTFSNVTVGSYTVQINEDGFLPGVFYVLVTPGNNTMGDLRLVPEGFYGLTTDLSGLVVDATTGTGDTITGTVTIELRRQLTGAPDYTFTTDADGYFDYIVSSGNFIMTVLSDGFVTHRSNVAIFGDELELPSIQLSPELEDESFRIVLSWGASPADLDAHLRGPRPGGGRFHVFWDNPVFAQGGTTYATLDWDVVDGFGPETVTIQELTDGRYEYFVHDFTNIQTANSTALRDSTATVRVYNNNGLYRVFTPPVTGNGNVWHVFSIVVQNGQPTVIPSTAALSTQSNFNNVGL